MIIYYISALKYIILKEDKVMEETTKMISPVVWAKKEEQKKLYLLLLVFYDGEEESEEVLDYNAFEFFTGTTQEVYDRIKECIDTTNDEGYHLYADVLKSKILVDSPKVKISDGVSIYNFMKNMKRMGKVVDDTDFNIDDYNPERDV